MSRQCTACHGSRVKDEYFGAHEGLTADVHLRERMPCTACHTGGEMHGTDYLVLQEDGTVTAGRNHRYDGPQGPSCESCHQDVIGIGSGNPYHEAHGTEVLSCQVCHAISYINCYDCHLERTEDDRAYFRLEHEDLGFFIGRNPLRSAERPYRFVPVRHVPSYPDLFRLYGENVLDQFDNLPTWTYATPHNIQRNTPQTESCESCHGNDAWFLTPDKLRPQELLANDRVIVPSAPPLPQEYRYLPVPGQAWDTSVVPPTIGGSDDTEIAGEESASP
jgi:thiosulfate/3-mercaptopyruvate sulfurtransferase